MATPLLLVPTKKQIKTAQAREKEIRKMLEARDGRGHLNNSITEGDGTLAGYVGEELVRDYYNFLPSDTDPEIFHYDALDPKHLGKIDVKTKRCTSEPKPEYNCSIAATGAGQQCDYYAFVRVLNDLSQAWILGFIPKADFFALSLKKNLVFKRGQPDPTSNRGWRFKWDCFNLPISDLLDAPALPADLAKFEYRPAAVPGFSSNIVTEVAT